MGQFDCGGPYGLAKGRLAAHIVVMQQSIAILAGSEKSPLDGYWKSAPLLRFLAPLIHNLLQIFPVPIQLVDALVDVIGNAVVK